ncbi:hypothetical protein BDZ45DRAFT_711151 [Acephala macrosclerotiorum]|nr:hypothetical protein BDZ45DRAFT_711151 [Acephala macrosclerotiorum]
MGRLPNHRFSVARNGEVTALEANIDSVKQYIARPFKKGFLEPLYSMGKGSKKRGGNFNSEDLAGGDYDGPIAGNGNGFRGGGTRSRNGRGDPQDDSHSGGDLEDQGASDPQANPNFGPYLEAIEELKTQMVAGQKAMKNVQTFFTRQKRDIEDAVGNRQQLLEMTKRCKEYKTTIKTLRTDELEKDEELAAKVADIEEERKELEIAKEEAVKCRKGLQEEKEKFGKRVSATEAEQKVKLQEQMMHLKKEQNEIYENRVKILERQTKERQDDDRKKIAELEAKNEKLLQELEEQKGKLDRVERKFKDAEMLKTVYEGKAEKLERDLKLAENEFGLNAETNEFYKERFLKIRSDIQDISSRYMKELHASDLKAIHDRIEKIDKDFTSVPISSSEPSATLLVVHAQRVISAQLRDIIWQPLSSEATLQDPKYALFFDKISEGLAEYYGKNGGLRAARLCTALALRGLQSQPPPVRPSSASTPSRAHVFSDKVMDILSLLVKPSLHPNFRGSLLGLAVSAMSVWDAAQTDEREIIVDFTLDPKSLEGWHAGIPADQNDCFVLFPRITARACPRIIDTRPVGPPGGWVDSEPEIHVQETCIYGGTGLGKWSAVVLEGEEEEEERKAEEYNKELEEQRRVFEEGLKKLKNPMAEKRRMSQNKKESTTEAASKVSAVRMKGAGQKINEGGD